MRVGRVASDRAADHEADRCHAADDADAADDDSDRVAPEVTPQGEADDEEDADEQTADEAFEDVGLPADLGGT